MVRDRQSEQEDRSDQYEERIVGEIVADLCMSLKDHEEYFLQEVIKKLRLDGQETSKKIRQTIIDVLKNDKNQYVQNVKRYREHNKYEQTILSALDTYAYKLERVLAENLPHEEIDKIVPSFMGFLQRKEEFLEDRKIDKDKSDAENFLGMMTDKLGEDQNKLDRLKAFLGKIGANLIGVQSALARNLRRKTIKFPKQEEIPEGDWSDLQYIMQELKRTVGEGSYEEFVSDFFAQTEEYDNISLVDVEKIIRDLIKEYRISGDIERNVLVLSDYLQRIRLILARKKDK